MAEIGVAISESRPDAQQVKLMLHERIANRTLPLGLMPGNRSPFQGDSLGDSFPRAKAPGLFCFRPSGSAKCPNCSAELRSAEGVKAEHSGTLGPIPKMERVLKGRQRGDGVAAVNGGGTSSARLYSVFLRPLQGRISITLFPRVDPGGR